MQTGWDFTPSQLTEIARLCDLAEAPESSAAGEPDKTPRQPDVQSHTADIALGTHAAAVPSDAALAATIDAVLPAQARHLPVVWLCGVMQAGVDAEAVAAMVREHCAQQGMPGADGPFCKPTAGNRLGQFAVVMVIGSVNAPQKECVPEPSHQCAPPVPQRVPADRCGSNMPGTRNKPPVRTNGKDMVDAPYAKGRLSAALFDLVNGTGVQCNG